MPRAFTLIELLVVVTIITVLVSMLVPAVEQAMYQAKLAACSANMKTVAFAANNYAQDNQQHYPARHKEYSWDALHIRANYDGNFFDLRATFAPYMALASFLDPMLGGIDLSDQANRPQVLLFANFNIYTGLELGNNPRRPAMEKVGQRFEWTDTLTDPGAGHDYEFNVIAGDRNMYWNDRWSASSHSDRGVLRNGALQDHPEHNVTISYWAADGGDHAPMDLNYAYTDGSVQRYGGVIKNDERMAKIVVTSADEYTQGRFDHLPRQ